MILPAKQRADQAPAQCGAHISSQLLAKGPAHSLADGVAQLPSHGAGGAVGHALGGGFDRPLSRGLSAFLLLPGGGLFLLPGLLGGGFLLQSLFFLRRGLPGLFGSFRVGDVQTLQELVGGVSAPI